MLESHAAVAEKRPCPQLQCVATKPACDAAQAEQVAENLKRVIGNLVREVRSGAQTPSSP